MSHQTEVKSAGDGELLKQTIRRYDASPRAYAWRFAVADMRIEQDLFSACLPRRHQPVLDAGCGTGRDLARFRRNGVAAIGLDLSQGLLGAARRCTASPLVQGDMLRVPFRRASFRGVWCCASLLHLAPEQAALAVGEFRRVLSDEGLLFILVRAGSSHGLDSSGRWFQLYERTELEGLLKAAGFAIISLTVRPRPAPGRWLAVLAAARTHAHAEPPPRPATAISEPFPS
ncbi:class I SAM-dependent methyltransferase [Plantactinospora sp. B6F1]|uniref:class I SAM-dependent methyltransferase n=1 Tax=Plantactinospora sp. B6F1 TaxID=3158971 RepID=UPI0032D91A8E